MHKYVDVRDQKVFQLVQLGENELLRRLREIWQSKITRECAEEDSEHEIL